MVKRKQKRQVKVSSSDKSVSSDSDGDASHRHRNGTKEEEGSSLTLDNNEIDSDQASDSSNSIPKNKQSPIDQSTYPFQSNPPTSTTTKFDSSVYSEDGTPTSDRHSRTDFKLGLSSSDRQRQKLINKGKKLPSPSEDSRIKHSSTGTDFKLGVVLVIVVCSLAVLLRGINEDESNHNSINVKELFLKDLDRCRTVSENQSKRFWKKLNLTAQHLSNDDPSQPLSAMFASSPFAADTREHMAKMLATAYSKKCGAIYHLVDGNDYKSLPWELAKKRLDDDIKRVFLPGHACALIVSNFHLLPPRAAELFFGLCDNDNADYKNASIIFTVEITHSQSWDLDNEFKYGFSNNEIPKPSHWDIIVDNFLTEYLISNDKSGLMDNSRIAALMSRILPTVLWVQQEDKLKCY